jgi:class 3 adenylate cyclase/predicted ATPase
MSALSAWLQELGLELYAPVFAQNDVDLEALGLLTESDLEKLGISLGHRKKLLRAIADRAGGASTALYREGAASQPSAGKPIGSEGERRQLTVLFCDLVGFTELASRLDPEALRGIIRRYEDVCAGVIARFEGYVFQRLGDGIVAYFGFPLAHEDEAERAIRAGLEIVQSLLQLELPDAGRLQVRVGISTGLVVVSDIRSADKSAVGESMNLAARLQAVALPGSIVVNELTRQLAGGSFEYEDLGRQDLKGIAHPVRVWRVLGLSPAESRFEAATRSGLTPLVGRAREIALLLQRWDLAQDGIGQVVLLSGEPGVGKSRILQELREELGERAANVLRYQCSAFYANTAFYPVTDNIERALHFTREEAAGAKLDKLEALMVGGNARPLLDVQLVAPILSIPTDGRYQPLGMTPQRQKEETIRAMVDLLEAASRQQPTLMLFEDVHWADPSTLEALDLLIDRLKGFPLLLVITHRPELEPKWAKHPHVAALTLSRLSRAQSASLALRLAGKRLPPDLLEQIVAKTDGVPLYLEELTKAVLESDVLTDAGDHYEHSGSLASMSIPATLRDSLMARLDRLNPVKEIAQVGAALGREFSYEMLRALAPLPPTELDDALQRLTGSGLVFRYGTPPDAIYTFKHALVQDAAYDSLLKSTRKQLHSNIARALEERFPATRDAKPELLAHHYTEAGQGEKAVPCWYQAGRKAVERSANIEAISHLTKGLEVLSTLADTPEHLQQELLLQTLLGNALMAIKGYGAPEVGRTFDRARELCERIGDTPQLFPVLRGLWMFYLVRSDLQTAREMGEQLLQLAQRVQQPAFLLEAHRALGMTRFFLGEFPTARVHLEQGIALYDLTQHRTHAFLYGTDPGVACLCYVAATLWCLGYPDQAAERLREGLHLGEQCSHAFSQAFALFFAAMLHQYRREDSAAQRQADADMALSSREGFVLWLAMATIVRGWARAEQGQREEGLAQMRQGLAAFQATGAGIAHTYILSLLAEGCGRTGRSEEGLLVLKDAVTVRDKTGERIFEAELYRLEGELTLQREIEVGKRETHLSGSPSVSAPAFHASEAVQQAQAHFLEAIRIAREQGAKSFELRATMGLCRMWRKQGRTQEARRALAEVYAWFTEGFDTADLQDARRLLEELG